jgi:hypothetical protein
LRLTIAARARRISARGEATLVAEFILGVVLELVAVGEEDVLVAEDDRCISIHTLSRKGGYRLVLVLVVDVDVELLVGDGVADEVLPVLVTLEADPPVNANCLL